MTQLEQLPPMVENTTAVNTEQTIVDIDYETTQQAPENQFTFLEIVEQLPTTRINNKTFIVKMTKQPQIGGLTIQNNQFSYSQHNQNPEYLNANPSDLKIAEIYDLAEFTNLKLLKQELDKQLIFVDSSPIKLKSYGFAVYDQAMAFVDHLNQIHYYQNGYCIHISDYVSNRTLSDIVKNQNFNCPQYQSLIRRLFMQIAQCVQTYHQKASMFFLSLNLRNILINDDLTASIGDISSAQKAGAKLYQSDFSFLKDDTYLSSFLAPEIFTFQSELVVNNKIDVYSLGVMLFAAITGGYPPVLKAAPLDNSFKFMCNLIKSGDLFFKRHPYTKHLKIPRSLQELVLGMIHPIASERFCLEQVINHPYFSEEESITF